MGIKQLLPVLCIKLPYLMVDIKDIRLLLLLDMSPLQPMQIKHLCPAASHLLPPLVIKLLLQVVTQQLPRDMLLQLQITTTNQPLWDIHIQPAAPILQLQPTLNQGLHIKHHHPPPLPATLLLAIPPSHHPPLPIPRPSQQATLTTKLPILHIKPPHPPPLPATLLLAIP